MSIQSKLDCMIYCTGHKSKIYPQNIEIPGNKLWRTFSETAICISIFYFCTAESKLEWSMFSIWCGSLTKRFTFYRMITGHKKVSICHLKDSPISYLTIIGSVDRFPFSNWKSIVLLQRTLSINERIT